MSDGVEELGPGRASPASRRPRWSQADRLRIIAESYRPKVSVSVVARHNDVNANLRFSPGGGGFASRLGDPGGLVPVLVEPAGTSASLADAARAMHRLRDASRSRWRTARRWPGFWRFWRGDDSDSGRCSCLAGDWRDRHAARHEHPGVAGPGGSRARPPCGGFVHFSRSSRRSRKMLVACRTLPRQFRLALQPALSTPDNDPAFRPQRRTNPAHALSPPHRRMTFRDKQVSLCPNFRRRGPRGGQAVREIRPAAVTQISEPCRQLRRGHRQKEDRRMAPGRSRVPFRPPIWPASGPSRAGVRRLCRPMRFRMFLRSRRAG